MSTLVLTEKLLAEMAGWEVMKSARAYVEAAQVLSSNWSPPLLKGVVNAGGTSYRCGLVIRGPSDVDNICSCRDARERGIICGHSVSVGLHHLKPPSPEPRGPSAHAGGTATTGGSATPTAGRQHITPASAPLSLVAEGADVVGLTLHVILPGQLDQALARGRLTVFFEAECGARRLPLDSLPRNQTYSCGPEDRALLTFLHEQSGVATPGLLAMNTMQWASCLPLLAGHPRVTIGKRQTVVVDTRPLRLRVRLELTPEGELHVSVSPLPAGAQVLAGADGLWAFLNARFQPICLPAVLGPALSGSMRLKRPQIPVFLARDLPQLEASCDVERDFSVEDFVCETSPPRFHLSLSGGLAQLRGRVQCAYGARILTAGVASSDDGDWLPDPRSPRRYCTRDRAAEQASIARLCQCGFSRPDHQGYLQLVGEDRVLSFLAREYPRLEKEWTVTLEERLQRSTEKNLERLEPEFRVVASGESWFDLEVGFVAEGGQRFSTADIQQLLLSGRSHAPLKGGKRALLDTVAVDEFQQVLRDCSPTQEGGRYRLATVQAGFVEATIQEAGFRRWEAAGGWPGARSDAGSASEEALPSLGALEGVLRAYQKHGVAWLWFLRQNGFGGILADEMGLGKTVQALALLQAAHDRSPEGVRPSLIVCPTSLVFNWLAEARRFTPSLKVLTLDGPRRLAAMDSIGAHDLAITSYALMRRDIEHYRGVEFDTLMLDEAQHIKNRDSQNAQAVKRIRASHRVVLTGTPLENTVLDLWSIFDFLMPGYLGTAPEFKERYEVPIVRDRDAAVQARLNRRLRPFVLRRLKREVAPELPARIDQTTLCELTSDQQTVYAQILDASRQEILAAVGSQGVARSRMLVLSALLRLRQVCCDLRLLQLPGEPTAAPSGKLALFAELLDEVLDGGHRVLVFSQFVEMLTLLREHLEQAGVAYAYLDGSTRDRERAVADFQQSTTPVFLISLKAGGTGLNLTGADTVIHFDPWWNPAVEDQATGRAHRIGQDRVVTSYKLIARGTVEEKILKLQERKREMATATLTGEAAVADGFSWEEIQELLHA